MRGFFVLLLITNLLFVGWQIGFEPESGELPPYGGMALTNDGLLILSELDEAKRPPQRKFIPLEDRATETPAPKVELIAAETPAEASVAVTPSITTFCYQSTPLVTLKEAKALQQSLLKLGIQDSRRETIQTHKVNYWVMLKAYKSLDKANEAADILKKQRVKDFFIVRSGRYENAVSLGVFSTKERAEKRYKQIAGLKVRLRKPLIEALELPAKRLIVRFELDETPVPEGLSALLDSSKESHLKKISCN
jgi:hypothetical protein